MLKQPELDKLVLVAVLLVFTFMLWQFRSSHDGEVFMQGVMTTVLGGLLGLVKGAKDQA